MQALFKLRFIQGNTELSDVGSSIVAGCEPAGMVVHSVLAVCSMHVYGIFERRLFLTEFANDDPYATVLYCITD